MEKRGQFYLIAAIIIIFVMIGFFVIGNYAQREEKNTKIYDLADELKLETGNVYDYGIYKSAMSSALIENWTDKYYAYSKLSGNIEDWIFVYGNESGMNATFITMENIGSVSIDTGRGTPAKIDITGTHKEKTYIPDNNIDAVNGKVSVKFKNFTHEFNLKTGENFYFVIKKGGYVARD